MGTVVTSQLPRTHRNTDNNKLHNSQMITPAKNTDTNCNVR